MKSIHYVITVFALPCLLLASGCKSPQPQLTESGEPTEHYYVETNILAVRYDAGSNVTENIVKRMKFHIFVNAEKMGADCVDKSIVLERPNQKPIRCKSLEDYGRKMLPMFWFGIGWHFQPIPGTNLWTAIEFAGFVPTSKDENWGFGIHGFNVHVFNEKKIISTKRLNPLSPPGCKGFAELRFDTTGRNLIYKTKDGYEVYDLLAGTVKPYDKPQPPAEWRVLLLADFQTDQLPAGPFEEPHPEKFSPR